MGLIGQVLSLIFGGGRNAVKETAEVFRENAEAGAERGKDVQLAAMAAHGSEFYPDARGLFDRAMDGLNRLPRPLMALGCLGLIISAMIDPIWFAARMQGIALVPEPLWWLLGVIVSFYFGARHQAKGQEFQRSIAASMAHVPVVVDNLKQLRALEVRDANPALEDWRKTKAQSATK